MAFSNEKFRLFWRFSSDAAEFSALSTAQGYGVDNLKRDTLDGKWKSSAFPNMVVNSGFETGDFTSWTATDATIDTINQDLGVYAAKLAAIGATVVGPTSQLYKVDASKVYTVSARVDVDVWSAGTHRLEVQFFDSLSGLISSSTMKDWTAVTSGYESVVKTFGPSTIATDINFPAGTAYVAIRVFSFNTPTGITYLDNVFLFIGEHVAVAFGTEEVSNGGFETGDFTGWTQNGSVIDGTNPASGAYASKIVAVGSNVSGASANLIAINKSKLYSASAKVEVQARAAGTYQLELLFYNSDSVLISAGFMDNWSAVTVGYETVTKTVGSTVLSPDISFPPGTAFMSIHTVASSTPTLTAFLDDASIYELQTSLTVSSFALLEHNIASSDFFKLMYADDANFTVNTGFVSITHHTDTFIEYFTLVSKRFWQLIISPLAPGTTREAGRLLLGDHYQMERNIGLGWAGPQYIQDTSRSVRTEGGQSYSDLGAPLKEFRGEFIAHDEADLDEIESLKQTMLTGASFIMSQNWEDFPVKRTLYGKLRSLGQPSNIAADKWTLPFSMTEQR